MTETPNLAAALVAALADLTVIEKGNTAQIPIKGGGSYSYSYADLADVVKRTRPILAEHGIVALTPLHHHGADLACSVVLLHESGDRIDFGPFPFPHGRDAQATGSMVTYMRRYALVAALGMAAGDDDDGAAAKPRQTQQSSPRHPLRDKVATLGDKGEHAWQRFLEGAGIPDAEADAVLATDSGGWATWLADAVSKLSAAPAEDTAPETGDAA